VLIRKRRLNRFQSQLTLTGFFAELNLRRSAKKVRGDVQLMAFAGIC